MRELTGGSGAPIERLKNAQSRRTTIRLLWLLIVTSIVLPLVLFGVAGFISYRELQALGLERMDRTQAVMQEPRRSETSESDAKVVRRCRPNHVSFRFRQLP
jgi:hypothetical protein